MRRFFSLPPGIWLGILSLLVLAVFRMSPVLTEYLYARGIYRILRIVLDYTVGFLPFPLIYLIVAALLFGLGRRVLRRLRERPKRSWKEKIKVAALNLGNLLGWVIFSFFMSWGYNYSRIPVETYLELDAKPLEVAEIKEEITWALEQAGYAREAIAGVDTHAVTHRLFSLDREEVLGTRLGEVLNEFGYPAPGRVRTKNLYPSALLSSLGLSGMYVPFAGESYVAGDLPILQKLATTAHEMAHGYGFGDEGTCNFWAFLTCVSLDDPAARYAGYLEYWRYLAREYYKADPESYFYHRSCLSVGMENDLRYIRDYNRQYRSWLSGLSSKVNNAYLKIQGVKEGVRSYSRVVVLIRAFRSRYPDWKATQ